MTVIDEVPIISLDDLPSDNTLGLIDYACREWGFFQLVDHDIDRSLISLAMEQACYFFDQSLESKNEIRRSRDNPWGFYDQELTKNVLDRKQIFDAGHGETTVCRWPTQPGFRQVVKRYQDACERLATQILKLIARNLGANATSLVSAFEHANTSFLRMNYYPVCSDEKPTGQLGLNRHTDAGALTLLLQDKTPGLQVFNRGQWHLVSPIPGAITVNIGDILQVWSNDLYKAAEHRVLASTKSKRYSLAYFFNPAADTDYGPLPTTVTPDNPPRYQTIRWGEFRQLRHAGDYEDLGQEVQISQFRSNGAQ